MADTNIEGLLGEPSPDPTAISSDKDIKKKLLYFKKDIERCKSLKRVLIKDWQDSIDFRRGKPYKGTSDQDRISVPLDWSLTKEKEAQLFSQVPAVHVNHPPQTISKEAAPWIHTFEQKLNDTAVVAGIESAMNEILPDCINAAGFGAVILSREAITDTVMLPSIDLSQLDPELQMYIMQSGQMPDGSPIPTEPTPRTLDSRYTINRISPSDFLWPTAFTGSDFDMAPWVGRIGRTSWPEAVQWFGLEESEKSKITGSHKSTEEKLDNKYSNFDQESDLYEDTVEFDEIFYKEHQCDSNASKFAAIHHLVFIRGREEPVINEPWKGQMEDPETGELFGCQKYPIRVLTLAYITDDPIPPSDSAVGRPQVEELNKSRTQMIKQRERSLPIRWFDVNRVDPTIQYSLMKGVWQGMIPVQGTGSNIIGEVARAGFPQENFAIDNIIKSDLNQTWQVGAGLFGPQVETGREAGAIQGSMQIRVARERAKVGKFFLGIMEVLGGLLAIFEDPASIGEGFTPQVSKALSYSILADSTVLLDSNQRLDRLMRFVNFFAKSGWVDVESIVREAATLSGLDPNVVVRPPSPRPPVEPNISLRFTGVEDVLNPLILAFLLKSGQAPDTKLIEQAKSLITASVAPPAQQQLPAGLPPDIAALLGGGMPPVDGEVVPDPPPPGVGEANPEWNPLGRFNRRVMNQERE